MCASAVEKKNTYAYCKRLLAQKLCSNHVRNTVLSIKLKRDSLITKFSIISVCFFFLLYFCGAFLLAVGGWDCTDIDFEIIAFVLINVIIVVKIGEKKQQQKNKETVQS